MIFYGKESLVVAALGSLAGQPSHDQDGMDNYRLRPAPQMTISTDFKYAGDTAIGSKYRISLDGTLINRNLDEVTNVDSEKGTSFPQLVDRMHYLRYILGYQGGALVVTDTEYNIILIARGGILQDLQITNSNNNMAVSADYTATIEFSQLDFFRNDALSQPFIDSSSESKNLVDMEKYKLKSFSDNWSFDFADEMYSDMFLADTEWDGSIGNLNYSNLSFDVEYQLDAEGYKYYNENGELIPAWETAKHFCQDRLATQITRLVSGALGIEVGGTNCSSKKDLTEIHGDGDAGLLLNNGNGGVSTGDFEVYNEQINCSVSEGEGKFSVSYKALVRRGNYGGNYLVRHKLTKDKNYNNRSYYNTNKSYSVKGTIEGLVLGGLSRYFNGVINLPSNGAFMVSNSPTFTYTVNPKYDNAHNHAANIVLNSNFTDLSDNFKQLLGITHTNLFEGTPNACQNGSQPYAYPQTTNFQIVSDYNNGSISYTSNYDASAICGASYSNISMNITSPTPITAEFLFPNGNLFTAQNPNGVGCVIQALGTYTKSTMDITITGRDAKYCCNTNHSNAASTIYNILQNSNGGIEIPNDIVSKLPSPTSSILTNKSKTLNIYTGEYTFNLSYILCTAGC